MLQKEIALHTIQRLMYFFLIAASTNMARKRRPPILLALIVAWFNSIRENNPETRLAHQTWIYNAICNAASLEHIFHLTLSHAGQVKKWEAWPREQQKQALEVMRTGTKDPIVDEMLSALSAAELFHRNIITILGWIVCETLILR